jgi:hypothetical protein
MTAAQNCAQKDRAFLKPTDIGAEGGRGAWVAAVGNCGACEVLGVGAVHAACLFSVPACVQPAAHTQTASYSRFGFPGACASLRFCGIDAA